jgi:hypothetical protein
MTTPSAYREGTIATWTAYVVATIVGVLGLLAGETWLCVVALLAQVCFSGGLLLGRYIERRHRGPVRPLYTLGVKPAFVKAGVEPDDWERVVPYNPNDGDRDPIKGHHPRVRRVPNSFAMTCSCSCGWKPSGQNPDDELTIHLAGAVFGKPPVSS